MVYHSQAPPSFLVAWEEPGMRLVVCMCIDTIQQPNKSQFK